MDLDAWSTCLKVLADPTRVRLLALLEREELTVAELSAVARLAQPRLSAHLARLKDAGQHTLPGGGAEILSERVRRKIAPKKGGPEAWLEVQKAGGAPLRRAGNGAVSGL